MAEKENILKNFDLLILNQEDCEQRDPLGTELVDLKLDDQEVGPFHPDDIRHFLKSNHIDMSEVYVKAINSDNLGDWITFYEHPLFSRRRPSLVSQTVLDSADDATSTDQYYILKFGMKTGPFGVKEIKNMLKTRELLLTDMVSIDMGMSFGRICEMEEFDRRDQSMSEDLPHLPGKELFSHSTVEALRDANHNMEAKLTQEAVANLAFFGNMKSLKDGPKTEMPREEIKPTSTFKWSKIFYGAVLSLSLFGIYTILQSPSEPTAAVAEKVAEPVGRKPASIKGAEQVEPQYMRQTESGKAPVVHKLQPIKINEEGHQRAVPSFKESKAFRKGASLNPNAKKLRDATIVGENLEDDNYYDDGMDPVELDPIRSQVSRETLNPSEYYDEDGAEGYQPRGASSQVLNGEELDPSLMSTEGEYENLDY